MHHITCMSACLTRITPDDVRRRNLDVDTVPSFLGGNCKCPHRGGCVQGIPNDQRNVTNDNVDADGLMT